MSRGEPWESFLRSHFPGYLLPEALRRALPEDAAARFLARLGGGPRQLFLLRAASVASAHADSIHAFACAALPALAAHLPARSILERRVSSGELRGRLDVAATLRLHLAGRAVALAARAPRSRRDRPEDVLAKAVAVRLDEVIRELSRAGVIGAVGWGAALASSASALAHALEVTALRDVPDVPFEAIDPDVARTSSHPAHALAAALHRALREGLDDPDPARIARVVAEGALAPLADHARFEIAVLLRLLVSFASRRPDLAMKRTIVAAGRQAVAEIEGREGTVVQIHYDQAFLDPGPYDAGLRRYFGQRGRLRPDITVMIDTPRGARAVLIEAKLSADPDYLAQSYRDAIVYRAEYGAALSGWPKVILVTSAPIASEPCREDEVIVVGWDRWVPDAVMDAILEEV
ncbi:Hypothetical protein A7982_06479 [Minicystis rosea]|nr:Hypothetical protein A7982_06479 [Minicystis rosea]